MMKTGTPDNRPPAKMPRVSRCLPATILFVMILATTTCCLAAPVVLAQDAAAPAAQSDTSDQPMAVPTGGSTFKKGFSYFLIALIISGALYSVCRSSNRT